MIRVGVRVWRRPPPIRDVAGSLDGSLDFLLGLVPVDTCQVVDALESEITLGDRADSGRRQVERLPSGPGIIDWRAESGPGQQGEDDG